MKVSGLDVRPGNIVEYDGGIWRAVKIQHTQPGRGGAYMQVEMKNLIDGRRANVRFRSGEVVKRIRLETRGYVFVAAEGDQLIFNENQNDQRVALPEDLLGDAAAFLTPGMDVMMELYDNKPVSVQLPDEVEATITDWVDTHKEQYSTHYVPALFDNGIRVMAPPEIGLTAAAVPICLAYALWKLIPHAAPTYVPHAGILALTALLTAGASRIFYAAALHAQATYGEMFCALFDQHLGKIDFVPLLDGLQEDFAETNLFAAPVRERGRAAIRFLRWHRYRRAGATTNEDVSTW